LVPFSLGLMMIMAIGGEGERINWNFG
jgi:hypothetical protein